VVVVAAEGEVVVLPSVFVDSLEKNALLINPFSSTNSVA